MSTFFTLGLRVEKTLALELFNKFEEVTISKQPGTKVLVQIIISSYSDTFNLVYSKSFKDTLISITINSSTRVDWKVGDFMNGIETGSQKSFNECLK